jgi:hypothetical protein
MFFPLNNLGGIINANESLVAGLQALGHRVENRLLVWKQDVNSHDRWDRRLDPETAAVGIPYDQERGWRWPASHRLPYQGKKNLQKWKAFAEQFDLIIWQIPVPSRSRQNAGNTDWLSLYYVDVPQIACIHDGNMWHAYPYIYAIKDHLSGAVGMHPCAYHSLQWLPVPRAMTLNPQTNIAERVKTADAHIDRSSWCSFQTFKAWKRVDELVRAVPHMTNTERKVLGGGGLHYYYMTSKDKLAPEYVADRSHDPDLPYARWSAHLGLGGQDRHAVHGFRS